MSVYAGFVDAGFLHAEGARSLKIERGEARLDALGVVETKAENLVPLENNRKRRV